MQGHMKPERRFHLSALRDRAENVMCYNANQLAEFLMEAHNEILRQRGYIDQLERTIKNYQYSKDI